ncbi:hypothetical protein FB567DRAFT_453315 [Paraphoma chrysanthemicola]|uniref:Uncharacterized protein n=1 Tax=Paraphoma chrysanthemicola TaxID=798071 RepID=A0A8K0VT80_9PLEO|nr:hypothetical protein FB567DRAFT_453315 [Paraphoma chrysanthemicola]
MTEKISKPRTRRKRENQTSDLPVRAKPSAPKNDLCNAETACLNSPKAVLDMPLVHPLSSADRRYSSSVERAVTAIRYHYRPPAFNQPSRIVPEALDTALISHLVDVTTKSVALPEISNIHWFQHMPHLYATTSQPAFKGALRAVSMGCYGKTHHDPSMLVDSYRWYRSSLNSQLHSYSQIQDSHTPTADEISLPLLLAVYCLYIGMDSTCSMDNWNAVIKLLYMAGPVKCATGLTGDLFHGVRSVVAFQAICLGQPAPFSPPDWMEIPFRNKSRDARQRLVDVELMIPACMQMLQVDGDLRTFFETEIPADVDPEPCRVLIQRLLQDVEGWALEYPQLTVMANDYGNGEDGANEMLTLALSKPNANAVEDCLMLARNVALAATMYVNTRLILNALMHKIELETSKAPPGIASKYYNTARQCTREILCNSTSLAKRPIPGGSLLRFVAPLVTVASVAPAPADLEEARAMLKSWLPRIGSRSAIIELNALARAPSGCTISGIIGLHIYYHGRGRTLCRD